MLLILVAACGDRSMFGPQLDQGLAGLDAALARGEVEVACARLNEVVPKFAEWAEGARGERAARGNQLLEQLAGLRNYCGAPGTADPAAMTKAWPPIYAEMRKISTYKTSWLTVFTYASMFAVGIGVYMLLRRMRRSA